MSLACRAHLSLVEFSVVFEQNIGQVQHRLGELLVSFDRAVVEHGEMNPGRRLHKSVKNNSRESE